MQYNLVITRTCFYKTIYVKCPIAGSQWRAMGRLLWLWIIPTVYFCCWCAVFMTVLHLSWLQYHPIKSVDCTAVCNSSSLDMHLYNIWAVCQNSTNGAKYFSWSVCKSVALFRLYVDSQLLHICAIRGQFPGNFDVRIWNCRVAFNMEIYSLGHRNPYYLYYSIQKPMWYGFLKLLRTASLHHHCHHSACRWVLSIHGHQ